MSIITIDAGGVRWYLQRIEGAIALFTQGLSFAQRFTTWAAAHQTRESAAFFHGLEAEFAEATVSIEEPQ
jgi:hypothetical protein